MLCCFFPSPTILHKSNHLSLCVCHVILKIIVIAAATRDTGSCMLWEGTPAIALATGKNTSLFSILDQNKIRFYIHLHVI